MSVIVTIRMTGASVDAFKTVAAENVEMMDGVAQRGKDAGAIHHAFYADQDGNAFVVDEWDKAESFQAFFEREAPNIGPLMQSAGVQGEPAVSFLQKIDTADSF